MAFRDDALCLWKAIETFIREVLSISYKSDDDVSNDTELQTWVQDILENGFPVRDGKGGHGFPEDLSTLDQLVHVLTCVVFTCSCQHAALNFGLMDAHSFVPFTPSIMRLPPPTKKNEATLNSIINTLPNKSQASQQIALMYVLSQFAEDEVRDSWICVTCSAFSVCKLYRFGFVLTWERNQYKTCCTLLRVDVLHHSREYLSSCENLETFMNLSTTLILCFVLTNPKVQAFRRNTNVFVE